LEVEHVDEFQAFLVVLVLVKLGVIGRHRRVERRKQMQALG